MLLLMLCNLCNFALLYACVNKSKLCIFFVVIIVYVTASTSSGTEQLPLSYVEPHWSGIPVDDFSLLIVKNGAEIGNLRLNDKPYHTFGRLPNCDVSLEHPSISRYHAVLQYRPAGVFICVSV